MPEQDQLLLEYPDKTIKHYQILLEVLEESPERKWRGKKFILEYLDLYLYYFPI